MVVLRHETLGGKGVSTERGIMTKWGGRYGPGFIPRARWWTRSVFYCPKVTWQGLGLTIRRRYGKSSEWIIGERYV